MIASLGISVYCDWDSVAKAAIRGQLPPWCPDKFLMNLRPQNILFVLPGCSGSGSRIMFSSHGRCIENAGGYFFPSTG